MTSGQYQSLRRVALRHARRAQEADDLLHEALLAAAGAGRLDPGGADAAWLSGVIARLAARQARDAVRRRRREQGRGPTAGDGDDPPTPAAEFLHLLPPAARRVAVLAVAGMTPEEIRYVLKLSDTAYRQRLTTIRRAWKENPRAASPAEAGELDFGVLRRALLEPARRLGRIGAHDPDGNLFLLGISSSQAGAPREQTGEASSDASGAAGAPPAPPVCNPHP